MSSRYRHRKTGTTVLRLDGHALRMKPTHTRTDHSYWGVTAWCACGLRYGIGTKQEARRLHRQHLRDVWTADWWDEHGNDVVAELERRLEEADARPMEVVRVREGLL